MLVRPVPSKCLTSLPLVRIDWVILAMTCWISQVGGILYRNLWSYIDNCWLSCQFHQLGYNLCIIQWFHGVLRLAATTVAFCRLHGLVDFSATLSIVVGDNIDSSCYFCWRQVTIFGAIDVCCCTLARFLVVD